MSTELMAIPVQPAEDNLPLDLLDREPFVNQLIKIAEMLSDKKMNACYAINGSWGVGKTFVLDMFEKQIQMIQTEETTAGKYLLFHYNCWQYDYYEEPLIAIIAAMLDAIDEQVHLLTEDKRNALKAVLKTVGAGVLNKLSQKVEDAMGVSLETIKDVIVSVKESAETGNQEARAYDTYFEFKKTVCALREEISVLAENQTVIIVVDELDRCLPEYAIKVLERLHHVFDEIPNLQMVLAIDKSQVEHAVKQIYGQGTSAEKYLAKFIDFEVRLTEGVIQNNFDKRFEQYVNCFSCQNEETKPFDVEEFRTKILGGIDVRTRISIINKCQLLHSMLATEESMDSAFMCVELLLSVLKYGKIDLAYANQGFNISHAFYVNNMYNPSLPVGLIWLNKLYEDNSKNEYYRYYEEDTPRNYIMPIDIYGIVLGCYRYLIGFSDNWGMNTTFTSRIKQYTKEFWQLLQTIS